MKLVAACLIMSCAILIGWLNSEAHAAWRPFMASQNGQGFGLATSPLHIVSGQQGGLAKTSVGKVGSRQNRQNADGIKPMVRIENRINNRVQLRIRSRIDQAYNPESDAATSIGVATNKNQEAAQPK